MGADLVTVDLEENNVKIIYLVNSNAEFIPNTFILIVFVHDHIDPIDSNILKKLNKNDSF